MKKLWGLLGVCIVSAFLGGCSAQEEENGICSVYYVNTHPYYATAVAGFQNKNREAQIELIGFESDEALVSQLATEMAAGKGPDVVLLSGDTQFDVYKAARSGQVLDLSKYMEKDEAYSEEDYVASVMEAGKILDERQLVLPFSFTMDVLYMTQSAYEEMGVTDEDLATFEAMSHMLNDYAKTAENNKITHQVLDILARQSFSQRIFPTANAIEASTLELNYDVIQDVWEMYDSIMTEYEEKADLLGKEINNPFDIVMSFTQNGNYFMRYGVHNGMTQYYMEEECIAVPWRNVDGKIQPYVCDFGLITSQSDSRQTAYDLLRFIMDYEIAIYGDRPMSVSVKQLKSLLNRMELTELDLKNVRYTTMQLNAEQKEALWQDIQNMDTANFLCCGYMDVISEAYRQNEDVSKEELEAALQRYLYE